MSDLFRERVTIFLTEYLDIPDRQLEKNGVAYRGTIKAALKMLVESVFTAEEITKELLRHDVILPSHQIMAWITEPQGG